MTPGRRDRRRDARGLITGRRDGRLDAQLLITRPSARRHIKARRDDGLVRPYSNLD